MYSFQMHLTAFENAQRFAVTYLAESRPTAVEIGSQTIKGQQSIRPLFDGRVNEYIGVDFVEGDGVDLVLEDPYVFPFEDDSVDVVVSSSCFEHSQFFWLTFLEMVRICKSGGLIYLNAPSNGDFHRYPVDCWRFYPDSGVALADWASRNGYHVTLLESFVSKQKREWWNDFVAVWVKGEGAADLYPRRIIDDFKDFVNGWMLGSEAIQNHTYASEDMIRRQFAIQVCNGQMSINWS